MRQTSSARKGRIRRLLVGPVVPQLSWTSHLAKTPTEAAFQPTSMELASSLQSGSHSTLPTPSSVPVQPVPGVLVTIIRFQLRVPVPAESGQRLGTTRQPVLTHLRPAGYMLDMKLTRVYLWSSQLVPRSLEQSRPARLQFVITSFVFSSEPKETQCLDTNTQLRQ